MTSSFFRSDKADIFVYFNPSTGSEEKLGLPRFMPGDSISGSIEITPSEEIRYKKLIIRVKWRTEGRGDRDEVVWSTIEEQEGVLIAGAVKSMPFSSILPSEPWSYAGRYISIVWGIDVEVDTTWKVNIQYFAPFILAPPWV